MSDWIAYLYAVARHAWNRLILKEERRRVRVGTERCLRATEDVYWNYNRRQDALLAIKIRCARLGVEFLSDEIIAANIAEFGHDQALDRILQAVA